MSSTESAGRRFWRRLLKNPLAVISLAWVTFIIACFFFPTVLAKQDPAKTDVTLTRIFEGPSSEFWLGTDGNGRDYYSRVIFGGQLALKSILIAMSIAMIIGVTIGLMAGWKGGRFDRIAMWIVDVLFSLPIVLLAMAVITVLEPSLTSAMIGIGLALSTRFARLTRAVTLAEREELYVDAARISGIAPHTILRRYVLPNLLPSLIVQITVLAGVVILIGAALSFLGVGANLQDPDWGAMLNASRSTFREHGFWQIVPSGGALVLTVLAFNLLGDGIRDAVGRDDSTNALTVERRNLVEQPDEPHNELALLSVRDLHVSFPGEGSDAEVLSGVSFHVNRGETLGIVGESGSGKSITVLTALGLTPAPGRLIRGSVQYEGNDITHLSEKEWNTIRGSQIGLIFQEPVASLNPALKVGEQLAEPLRRHLGLGRAEARKRAVELLQEVHVPDPKRRVEEYPHQLSGGMAQRVGIAAALACEPTLLIADEPTTALDVTVQGQILDLLAEIQAHRQMAIILITHDLGVIAELADRVAVMYGGQVVEDGDAATVFGAPRHPYTQALLNTMPQSQSIGTEDLQVIPGMVPPATEWPTGCRFAPRCEYADDTCTGSVPESTILDDHLVRCHHATELMISKVRQ